MPLNLDELNDIYDEGIGGDDEKVPPPKKGPIKMDDFHAAVAADPSNHSPIQLGGASTLDVEPYAGYNTEGVYSDRDVNAVRGQNQSAWAKWGNFALRTTAKVGTSLLEGVGDLIALGTEWGDDRDYSNALTEAAKSMNASLDENLPIYRTTNGIWGGPTDLGWWLNNAEGLVASVGAFALEGAGIAKLVTGLGKATGLARGTEALLNSRRFGQIASQGLTASSLAYIEGAQMGKDVFDTVYKKQLDKALASGLGAEEADARAKHYAAQSASTTVQLNTILGTMTNMYSVLPFFNHADDAVARVAGREFGQLAGESLDTWRSRLSNYTARTFGKELFKTEGKSAMVREAFMEGVEELNNQFAERTGKEEGIAGRTHGLLAQLGQLSNWADRTMDAEGGLNFMLGAIAGPATNVVTTNIPMHRVQEGYMENTDAGTKDALPFLDKSGQPVATEREAAPKMSKFMTSRAMNAFGSTQYFNNIRDAVLEDVTYYKNKHEEIAALRKAGNHEKADNLVEDLFNLESRRSVQLGYGNNLMQEYQGIAQLDNTTLAPQHKAQQDALNEQLTQLGEQRAELDSKGQDVSGIDTQIAEVQAQLQAIPQETEAMRKGMTASMEDNRYKEKAERAVKDIKELQKIHDRISSKYGERLDSNNPAHAQLQDFIFQRYARLYLMEQQRADYEKEIEKYKNGQDVLSDVLGGTELTNHLNQQQEYQRMMVRHEARKNRIAEQTRAFNNALTDPSADNIAAILPMLESNGAIGVSAQDIPNAIQDTLGLFDVQMQSMKDMQAGAIDALENSNGYQQWAEKNPDKTFKDYTAEIDKKAMLSHREKMLQSNLEELESNLDSHRKNLATIEQQRTMTSIVKKTEDWWKELAEAHAAYVQETATIRSRDAADKVAKARMSLLQMKKMRNDYIKEMEAIQRRIKALEKGIQILKTALDDSTTTNKDWSRFMEQKNQYGQELETLKQQLAQLMAAEADIASRIAAAESATPVATEPLDPGEDMDESEDEGIDEDGIEDDEELPNGDTDTESEEASVDVPPAPITDGAVTIPTEVEQAYIDYNGIVDTLNPDAQVWVRNREIELLDSPGQIANLDELGMSVRLNSKNSKKGVTQGQAVQVLRALNDYVQLVNREKVELSEMEDEAEEASEAPLPEPEGEVGIDDRDTTTVHDSPPLDTTEIEEVPQNKKNTRAFRGLKITLNVANTLAGSDLVYDERIGSDGNYVKVAGMELNPNLSPAILDPKGLAAGTAVTLRIDPNYETFDSFLDSNGKIRTDDASIGNVPIMVVHGVSNQQLKGRYMRTTDWVRATAEDSSLGPEGYRNVYDGSNEEEDIKRGLSPGNVERRAKELLEVRRKFVEAYNNGKTEGFNTKILRKDAGHPIMNRNPALKKKVKIAWERASKLLPANVQIGILSNGIVSVDSAGTETDKDIVTELVKGAVNRAVFLLPGNNGQFHAAMTRGTSLMETRSALNTMSAVFEAHLTNDPNNKIAKGILENTPFDILTHQGLRDFINQYFTHTTDWGKTGKDQRVLDIMAPFPGHPTSRIMIGSTYAGVSETNAVLKNGKLDPVFKQALEALLSTRFRNVVYSRGNVKGINDMGTSRTKFIEPRISSNGAMKFVEHDNYNAFIKGYLETYVNGTMQSNGKYVYSVNPEIEYDMSSIQSAPSVVVDINRAIPIQPVITLQDKLGAPENYKMYEDLVEYSKQFAQQYPDFARIIFDNPNFSMSIIGSTTDPNRNKTAKGDLDTAIQREDFGTTGFNTSDYTQALERFTQFITESDPNNKQQASLEDKIGYQKTNKGESFPIDVTQAVKDSMKPVLDAVRLTMPAIGIEQEISNNILDEIDDIFDSRISTVRDSFIVNGTQVTDENLNAMVTLAQESGRYNGQTVEQVKSYLLDNGIVSLYPGFKNPFMINCT